MIAADVQFDVQYVQFDVQFLAFASGLPHGCPSRTVQIESMTIHRGQTTPRTWRRPLYRLTAKGHWLRKQGRP
jgi:hypothetical protein